MKSNNIVEFISEYRNRFEKRKYYKINKEYRIEKKEPSFILEIADIYFESSDEKLRKKAAELIQNDFSETFVSKDKRIERLSGIEFGKLTDSFKRAVLNGESVHSVKLGNEVLHRDRDKFFQILYNIALISVDENRLIKTYFTEKLLDKIENLEKNSFNKNREQVDEIVRNIVNYFTKSETGYIDFENEESVKYFAENKADLLYREIYEKNFDKITEKYDIRNVKKINIDKEFEKESLSNAKKILYSYYFS